MKHIICGYLFAVHDMQGYGSRKVSEAVVLCGIFLELILFYVIGHPRAYQTATDPRVSPAAAVACSGIVTRQSQSLFDNSTDQNAVIVWIQKASIRNITVENLLFKQKLKGTVIVIKQWLLETITVFDLFFFCQVLALLLLRHISVTNDASLTALNVL